MKDKDVEQRNMTKAGYAGHLARQEDFEKKSKPVSVMTTVQPTSTLRPTSTVGPTQTVDKPKSTLIKTVAGP